jgi:AcrR family transcriptional regulator
MKLPRVDVGRIRREQIVEAAAAIIAEEGLQNLSLSAIEERAGMSRGQLTYYFPAKEDILLAVFDRLLHMMHERVRASGDAPCQAGGSPWERLEHLLTFLIVQPPAWPEFHALQYTFLSQMGHRDDFRQRLASLYEEWRSHMAADLAPELERSGAGVSARTLASFIQALLHGLAMQRAADPDAYDRHEMLALCLQMLGLYLAPPHPQPLSPRGRGVGGEGGRPAKQKAPRKKTGAAAHQGTP